MKQLFMGALALLVACGAPQSNPKSEQRATPLVEGATIELLPVDRTGGKSINEALWERRSSRDFSAEPLTLEELSGVVWAAGGVNRPENNHLTAPSALALYPIRLYAFLPQGAYAYDPVQHTLTRLVEGDYRPLTAMQEFANRAALNLVYVADRGVYAERQIPAEKVTLLCGLDAAGYAENVNLYAAAHDLKAITRGSYREAELLQLLGLDPARYAVALAQTVGK